MGGSRKDSDEKKPSLRESQESSGNEAPTRSSGQDDLNVTGWGEREFGEDEEVVKGVKEEVKIEEKEVFEYIEYDDEKVDVPMTYDELVKDQENENKIAEAKAIIVEARKMRAEIKDPSVRHQIELFIETASAVVSNFNDARLGKDKEKLADAKLNLDATEPEFAKIKEEMARVVREKFHNLIEDNDSRIKELDAKISILQEKFDAREKMTPEELSTLKVLTKLRSDIADLRNPQDPLTLQNENRVDKILVRAEERIRLFEDKVAKDGAFHNAAQAGIDCLNREITKLSSELSKANFLNKRSLEKQIKNLEGHKKNIKDALESGKNVDTLYSVVKKELTEAEAQNSGFLRRTELQGSIHNARAQFENACRDNKLVSPNILSEPTASKWGVMTTPQAREQVEHTQDQKKAAAAEPHKKMSQVGEEPKDDNDNRPSTPGRRP